jgi:hypothetical protein
MCTVVFIPDNNKKYFASLRDESPKRPQAIAPQLYRANEIKYLMPKDALAGGTWAGINEHKNVIVLLNGAFENHNKKEFYLKSRGIIVSELLSSLMPIVDWQLMDFTDIEPFTLVVWSDNHLFELVWDGSEKHRSRLDASAPHIWSSSTLYDKTSKINREELFQNWIAMQPPITKLSVLKFFKSTDDPENGFIINRSEKTKTLSYSFIELSESKTANLDYYDLKNFKHHSKSIDLFENSGNCLVEKYNIDLYNK